MTAKSAVRLYCFKAGIEVPDIGCLSKLIPYPRPDGHQLGALTSLAAGVSHALSRDTLAPQSVAPQLFGPAVERIVELS